jgi:hypothetical protein
MLVFGYGCLGMLVGLLVGLTSSPITTTILAALFTLAGGSVAPILKNSEAQRSVIGSVLAAFCLCCLVGVASGITVKVNRFLDLQPVASNETYLKSATISDLNRINVQYRHGELMADQAYEQLWNAIHQ